MRFLILLLIGTLIYGQVGGISVSPGVVIYIHDIVLVLVYISAIIKFFRSKRRSTPKLIFPIVSFFVIGLLSLVANSARFSFGQLEISSLYLFRWLFYAGLYVVVAISDIRWDDLFRAIYTYGIVFGVVGIIQYMVYPDLRNLVALGWDPHYYRLVSTFLVPNYAGFVLVLTFLLGLHLWSTSKKNVYYLFGQTVLFVTIYLTYSRSAYLALVAGGVSWIIIEKRWKLVIVASIALVLLVILSWSGNDTHQLLRIETSIARLENWKETIHIISQKPIIGYGFNTLRYVWGRPIEIDGVITRAGAGVDSSILFVLATTGVLGLMLYAWIYGKTLRWSPSLVVPVLIALVVNSNFINSAFYPWVMLWIWLILGGSEKRLTSRT